MMKIILVLITGSILIFSLIFNYNVRYRFRLTCGILLLLISQLIFLFINETSVKEQYGVLISLYMLSFAMVVMFFFAIISLVSDKSININRNVPAIVLMKALGFTIAICFLCALPCIFEQLTRLSLSHKWMNKIIFCMVIESNVLWIISAILVITKLSPLSWTKFFAASFAIFPIISIICKLLLLLRVIQINFINNILPILNHITAYLIIFSLIFIPLKTKLKQKTTFRQILLLLFFMTSLFFGIEGLNYSSGIPDFITSLGLTLIFILCGAIFGMVFLYALYLKPYYYYITRKTTISDRVTGKKVDEFYELVNSNAEEPKKKSIIKAMLFGAFFILLVWSIINIFLKA